MTQSIVPALPAARIQYERWYQLGLQAVLNATTSLKQLQADSATGQISAFPRFTILCVVHHGDDQVAAIKQAALALKVVPIEVDISHDQVALTFGLNWLQAGLPVWQPTDARVLHLYDGLLTNLLETPFQPITAMQVTVSDLATARLQPSTQAPARIAVQPSFHNYGVDLAAGGLLSVVVAPALQWQSRPNGLLQARGYAGDEAEELCSRATDHKIIPFPKGSRACS
ncbi:hypothetical protein [Lactiplantibacillus songbeiensis]|uniref:Uncharacterized protein n=1 Tax=Lactiplantibacillus songbeiensis TaxID=2559920 RepID=A0ABW4C0P5_9LACO|nr:hypothetical protein [Lactiplantibacillus songbeiensis]